MTDIAKLTDPEYFCLGGELDFVFFLTERTWVQHASSTKCKQDIHWFIRVPVQFTGWAKKVSPQTLVDIFMKYRSIFKILSLLHLARNLQ